MKVFTDFCSDFRATARKEPQALVKHLPFLCWLLNTEQALRTQLHHGPESKWNKVRQKTFCDWGFKVVPRDYT